MRDYKFVTCYIIYQGNTDKLCQPNKRRRTSHQVYLSGDIEINPSGKCNFPYNFHGFKISL